MDAGFWRYPYHPNGCARVILKLPSPTQVTTKRLIRYSQNVGDENSKIGFSKYDGSPNFTRLLHESLLKYRFNWHGSLQLNTSFQQLLMFEEKFDLRHPS